MPQEPSHATRHARETAVDRALDAAFETVRGTLGAEHTLWIDGRATRACARYALHSPADTRVLLGRFQAGEAPQAQAAVDAARRAYPAWSRRPWPERVAILRRAVTLLEERLFEIGAVLSLEAGKTRVEALAEAQKTVDLVTYACDEMERHDGFHMPLAADPVPGFISTNASVMKPYGVWLVIAPCGDPLALAGGPAAAALVAGNTVVCKGASLTPWSGRLLAGALHDAGVPPGAFNHLTGPGTSLGEALVGHDDIAGVTFAGSTAVGLHLVQRFAASRWPRPCIVEMGGKNVAIVSGRANLAEAAVGVARSAFGHAGQKASACSRVYVEHAAFNDFVGKLHAFTAAIGVGDPSMPEHAMGPVIDSAAVARFEDAVAQIRGAGEAAAIVHGGERLDHGALAHGHFCAPTIARLPVGHALWQRELLVPLLLVAPVDDLETAMALANAGEHGLAAGFYGSDEEAERFLDGIEAGVAYVNRPHGATTGAWPGHQPFVGWKGSGSTGRGVGSVHYLPQYLREQSQARVRRA